MRVLLCSAAATDNVKEAAKRMRSGAFSLLSDELVMRK